MGKKQFERLIESAKHALDHSERFHRITAFASETRALNLIRMRAWKTRPLRTLSQPKYHKFRNAFGVKCVPKCRFLCIVGIL